MPQTCLADTQTMAQIFHNVLVLTVGGSPQPGEILGHVIKLIFEYLYPFETLIQFHVGLLRKTFWGLAPKNGS